MKKNEHKNLKRWSLIGLFVIFALASLWHSLYEWLPCPLTAVFCPVNESPWEHTKLFFAPALIYFVIGWLTVGKTYPNFTFAHAAVLPLMPLLMLALHYFFHALGVKSLIVHILITIVVIVAGIYAAYRMTVSVKQMGSVRYRMAAMLIVMVLIFIFITFTFYPPHIPLFQDSNTLQYGIPVNTNS